MEGGEVGLKFHEAFKMAGENIHSPAQDVVSHKPIAR